MNKRSAILTLLTAAALTTATAQRSVLAEGSWWDLTVRNTGLCRVTASDVSQLMGADVANIGVYGSGGEVMPIKNGTAIEGGLAAVDIEVVDRNGNGRFDADDAILFYAEGPDTWRYQASMDRWQMEHHPYATANHYFLTTTQGGRRVEEAAAPSPAAADTATTYTAVAAHNNDLTNIYETGQLWMGERFSSTLASRSISLNIATPVQGPVKVRYALAAVTGTASTFSVSAPGIGNSHSISKRTIYAIFHDETPRLQNTYTFQIGFTPASTADMGYLDFIELNAEARLRYSGTPLVARAVPHGARTFAVEGAVEGMEVWRVHPDGRSLRMPLDRQGSTAWWTDTAAASATYLLFTADGGQSPAAASALPCQDLLGSAARYVVVAHPSFLGQAQRLATLHELFDTLSTLVVTDRMVYNEFSSGKQDPMALRRWLRQMRSQHPEEAPQYLVLFGKGTYDNRNLLGHNLPTVVTYQTHFSFDDLGDSYSYDDIIGYLDSGEQGTTNESLDVAVGRIPARNAAEADHLVNKIEGYMTRRDLADPSQRGDWRNHVALLSDDADPSKPGDTSFVHSSEVTARAITSLYPTLNIDRLYADAYRQQSGTIGSYFPDLNNALRQRINSGCLILNYIGHGSTYYIGTERYIEPSDISAYSNVDRLPFVIASTCTYGHYDMLADASGAELFLLADGGAIGVAAASRPISHMHAYNNSVIIHMLQPGSRVGDALRQARNSTYAPQPIVLLGDPALVLSQPENRAVVTAVNHRPVRDGEADSAAVLSTVTISGEIQTPDGTLAADFDGTIYPVVFDRPQTATTLANDNPGTEVRFTQQKNVLYRGSHSVSGGRFEYSFTVPRDVAYQYACGKVSHYARSRSDDHAAGYYTNILFGGLNDTAELATSRPTVRLFMGDTNFRSGGITDASPLLIALLDDPAGINSVGSGIGHDITAILDGNPNSLIVLNDFFMQDEADSRRGTVSYQLSALAPGRHTLVLKAWNIYNLSNSDTLCFTVRATDTATFSTLAVSPNPATTVATIALETNSPAGIDGAWVEVFSTRGELLLRADAPYTDGSFVVGPVRWDVSSVPPGLYLVRMTVSTTDGEVHRFSNKCIVR